MTNNNLLNLIHVTENHTGKMEGYGSISTSVLQNEYCLQNRQCEGSTCKECYAVTTVLRYTPLGKLLENNFAVLTGEILPLETLPYTNYKYFRFEAFGDIANENHFINYLNICYKNQQTNFALWTKNPQIIDVVFNDMKYKKPENLQIVVSSLYLNVVFNIEALPYKKRYWFIDKIFTVYTMDYAIKNRIPVNCGGKRCIDCNICYMKKESENIVYIHEILKAQWNAYNYTMNVLNDYKLFLSENELTHNVESTNLYISSVYYDLCDSYDGKHENLFKWVKAQEKKIEKAINTYIEYVL